jgi:hypothetical protein
MKLSESLKINSNNIRIREFTMSGQSLRVRVPLASEMEAMNERVKNVSWEDQYKKMTDPIIEKKETFDNEEIQFTDDDVIINGKSTKELAKVAAQTNARIVEMFKLLVPVIDGADLSELTYADIESEFPFSVQLDVSKKIAEVISPGYEETRKN